MAVKLFLAFILGLNFGLSWAIPLSLKFTNESGIWAWPILSMISVIFVFISWLTIYWNK